MPFTNILILVGIIAAFAAFGLTLAWGERQTRNLVRVEKPEDARQPADHTIKKAA